MLFGYYCKLFLTEETVSLVIKVCLVLVAQLRVSAKTIDTVF
jgi:hypothetical protein